MKVVFENKDKTPIKSSEFPVVDTPRRKLVRSCCNAAAIIYDEQAEKIFTGRVLQVFAARTKIHAEIFLGVGCTQKFTV